MVDVFISYSRKDSAQAFAIAERLRADGMSVWIDQHGIPGAEQWATEIATAIRECTAFLLLISENATLSVSVLKEIALASEKRKRIVPVTLVRTVLPVTFEYHLAGIQRIPIAEYDAIVAALRGKAMRTEKNSASHVSNRETLMVLPFEDLSPEQNNGWFADGLTNELISSLAHIDSLRVIDRNTSMDFKGSRSQTRNIASDLDVRYFLEGYVRKFGDHIRIGVELLDIATGDYLWHDSHNGEFADIFDIQESVAKRVVEGLRLRLSKEEEQKIASRSTRNSEAYELYLRACDYYALSTSRGMGHAIEIAGRAIELDAKFPEAMRLKAAALSHLYRLWDRQPRYLEEAEALLKRVRALRPDSELRSSLITLYVIQGRFDAADVLAHQGLRENPAEAASHFMLGYFYFHSGQTAQAVGAYEEALRLQPEHRMTHWNLAEALDRAGRTAECSLVAERALPHFERWSVLHPDDQFARVQYALLLHHAGHVEAALRTAAPLIEERDADGLSLYTIAMIYARENKQDAALGLLDRAVDAGFAAVELLSADASFSKLGDDPRFQQILQRLPGTTLN